MSAKIRIWFDASAGTGSIQRKIIDNTLYVYMPVSYARPQE